MGTAIVGLIIVGIVTLIVRGMIRDKKKGKPVIGCSGDCSRCHGSCH